MQGNDPKHNAHKTLKWLRDNNITMFDLPLIARLNPIEHLWNELDRNIPKFSEISFKHFEKAVFDCWSLLGREVLVKPADRMPNRLKCVIAAKGGPTRY
jgi:hypothetical protein